MAVNFEIIPLADLSDHDLRKSAGELHQLVRENQQLLVARHLFGVVARHSVSPEQSYAKLSNHKQVYAGKAPSAVVRVDGHAAGMANAMPDLPLREQPNGLRPKLSKILGQGMPRGDVYKKGMNVSAYTLAGNTHDVLKGAYTYLREESERLQPNSRPWTIEPLPDSHRDLRAMDTHAAIVGASYTNKGDGYFDDSESNRDSVPRSTLYVYEPELGELPDVELLPAVLSPYPAI